VDAAIEIDIRQGGPGGWISAKSGELHFGDWGEIRDFKAYYCSWHHIIVEYSISQDAGKNTYGPAQKFEEPLKPQLTVRLFAAVNLTAASPDRLSIYIKPNPLLTTSLFYVIDTDNILAMESEKQVNRVFDEETPTDSITSTPVQDEVNQIPQARSGADSNLKEETQSPVTESSTLEQWNEPRINRYRYLTTLYTFIIMGMNDAAYGVSSPATSSRITWSDDRDFLKALIPYVSPLPYVIYIRLTPNPAWDLLQPKLHHRLSRILSSFHRL
jgi:hypothetical protein